MILLRSWKPEQRQSAVSDRRSISDRLAPVSQRVRQMTANPATKETKADLEKQVKEVKTAGVEERAKRKATGSGKSRNKHKRKPKQKQPKQKGPEMTKNAVEVNGE